MAKSRSGPIRSLTDSNLHLLPIAQHTGGLRLQRKQPLDGLAGPALHDRFEITTEQDESYDDRRGLEIDVCGALRQNLRREGRHH